MSYQLQFVHGLDRSVLWIAGNTHHRYSLKGIFSSYFKCFKTFPFPRRALPYLSSAFSYLRCWITAAGKHIRDQQLCSRSTRCSKTLNTFLALSLGSKTLSAKTPKYLACLGSTLLAPPHKDSCWDFQLKYCLSNLRSDDAPCLDALLDHFRCKEPLGHNNFCFGQVLRASFSSLRWRMWWTSLFTAFSSSSEPWPLPSLSSLFSASLSPPTRTSTCLLMMQTEGF